MKQQPFESLERNIRKIYAADPDQALEAIETYLQQEMKNLPLSERLVRLEQIGQLFGKALQPAAHPEDDFLEQLVQLLLGRNVRIGEHSASDLAPRLAKALNAVFNQLNELIGMINLTLGGNPDADETIRGIIGGSLQASGETQSIEEYLRQIKTAFLMAQQASQTAAKGIVDTVLAELDPKTMAAGGFKLGAFKKSDAFDHFEEKYQRIRKWFDSDRFTKDFLRWFEKSCQAKDKAGER